MKGRRRELEQVMAAAAARWRRSRLQPTVQACSSQVGHRSLRHSQLLAALPTCPPACPALLVLVLTVALFPPLKVRQPLSFAHSALKLWPAVPMDRTRKTFSISGTTHKYNNYTNSSLPRAILKLTKPASFKEKSRTSAIVYNFLPNYLFSCLSLP